MPGKGIPRFKATEEQRKAVRAYAGVGLTHEQMALLIDHAGKPISTDTLTRHFGPELQAGKAQTIARVGGRLVQTALGQIQGATVADEIRAGMFYLKTQAGWREVDRLEVDDLREDRDMDDAAIASRIDSLLAKAAAKRKASGETVQ